jgi:hypothetical protein
MPFLPPKTAYFVEHMEMTITSEEEKGILVRMKEG